MGVRKRHNKWWVDFCFNRTRYRRVSPDNTRKGAEAYEAVLKQRLARGEPVDGIENKKSVGFKEFAADWFQTYVKNNNKHTEIRTKERILRVHLLPFFGHFKLYGIGNLDIEKYKARKIGEGLNPKTINNHLTVLSKCLRTAMEWEALESFPIIKRLKTPPQAFDFLNADECRLLIDSANGFWKDMIEIALDTGLRFGELTAITWDDVDLKNRELTVRQAFAEGVLGSTKGNKIRRVPMTDAVYEAFSKMERHKGYIFLDSEGLPLRHSGSVKKLQKICKKAGIRSIGWHTLRHTFASHLAQSGANLVAIQHLLGHTDIRTTMRYAHINSDVLRKAINHLNKENAKEGVEGFRHYSVTGAVN